MIHFTIAVIQVLTIYSMNYFRKKERKESLCLTLTNTYP